MGQKKMIKWNLAPNPIRFCRNGSTSEHLGVMRNVWNAIPLPSLRSSLTERSTKTHLFAVCASNLLTLNLAVNLSSKFFVCEMNRLLDWQWLNRFDTCLIAARCESEGRGSSLGPNHGGFWPDDFSKISPLGFIFIWKLSHGGGEAW